MKYYLFFFSIFFPFISPFPLNTDLQPLYIIFSIPLATRHFTKTKLILFSIIFFYLSLHITPQAIFSMDQYEHKKILTFAFSFYIYILFSEMIDTKNRFVLIYMSKAVNISIMVYFFYSILIIINPSTFNEFQSHFLRHLNIADIYSSRGISTFSTEPGLFAGILISFLLINDYIYLEQIIDKKKYRFNFLLVIIMILLTKSGTGYVYLLLYLLWKLKNNALFITFIILFFSLAIFLVLQISDNGYFINNRGAHIIVEAIKDPYYLIKDLSTYTRLYSLLIGINCIIENFVGYGVSNIDYQIYHNVIIKNSCLYNFPKLYEDTNIYIVSGLTYFICMYGIIALLAVLYILYKSKTPFINKFFSLLFMTFSFSFAFPLTWLLLNLKRK